MSDEKFTTVKHLPHVAVISLPDGCTPGRREAADYFAEAFAELRRKFPQNSYQFIPFDHENSQHYGGVNAWLAVAQVPTVLPAIFGQKIEEVPFGTRVSIWLRKHNIQTVSEIVLNRLPTSGDIAIPRRYINRLLETQGLRIGMTLECTLGHRLILFSLYLKDSFRFGRTPSLT